MMGRRQHPEPELDYSGDYDSYGMPVAGSKTTNGGANGQLNGHTQRGSIASRLLKFGQSSPALSQRRGFNDDDDDDGEVNVPSGMVDHGQFPDMSMRDLATGLRDRQRYPTFDDSNGSTPHSRTMSMTSNSTFDTTPVIPMLGGPVNAGNSRNSKVAASAAQYRQKMIDSRRALMSSETGLPAQMQQRQQAGYVGPPFAPGAHQGDRAMSLSAQSMHSVQSFGPGRNSRLSNASNMSMQSPQFPHMQRNGHGARPGSSISSASGPAGPASGGDAELHMRLQDLAAHAAELEHHNKALHQRNQELQANAFQNRQPDTPNIQDPDLGARYDELLAQHNQLLSEHTDLHERYAEAQNRPGEVTEDQVANIRQQAARDMDVRLQSERANWEAELQAKMDARDASQREQITGQLRAEMEQDSQLRHADLTQQHSRDLAQRDMEIENLRAQLYKLEQQGSVNRERELDTAGLELQETNKSLVMQLAGIQEQHQDVAEKYTTLSADHQKLLNRHDEMRRQHEVLTNDHRVLKEEHGTVVSQNQAAASASSTVGELQELTVKLQEEVRTLSIELAEASRRELGLPTNHTSDALPAQLAAAHKDLVLEREKRLIAEDRLPARTDEYNLAELQHSHSVVTQLLDVRNQHYDDLKQRLETVENDLASVLGENQELRESVAAAQSAVPASQYKELSEHADTVREENVKLQSMLDELSDKSPLGERLQALEDQRNVLQEALRSLRERKDQEIHHLADRVVQLESRLDNETSIRHAPIAVPARMHSSSAPPSEVALASPVSANSSGNGMMVDDAFSDDNEQLEVPKLRQVRPSSPLHLNFKLRNGDYFSEATSRARSESRTEPLPLALGSWQD